jgi:hypothetical protein
VEDYFEITAELFEGFPWREVVEDQHGPVCFSME